MTIESKDSFDADGIPDDEMLGGATFVEAVIHAESVEPENEHVKYIKEHGLADVKSLLRLCQSVRKSGLCGNPTST